MAENTGPKGMDSTSSINNNNSTSTARENIFFIPAKQRLTKLPELFDHFNSKDLKTLFKCSAAAWIYTILIFINPTLRVMGQACFFGAIVLFMAPPSGIVFIGLLAGITVLIGVCLGWAWGTITMKAALATRPAADLQNRYIELARLRSANTTNTQQASGQTSYAQIAVFNGFFLDARVSVTYFCMMGLFIYLIARLRVQAPKLTLLVIFSIVICDIYLTIAPLIPTFSGTIPQTFIKPAAIAVGISFVCNILFFPRSTSHIVLEDMQAMLRPMNEFSKACMINLHDSTKQFDLVRLKETRKRIIESYRTMMGNLAFLSLDASMGRFSADDIRGFSKPLRQVMVAFLSLAHTQISRQEHNIRDKRLLRMAGLVAADQKAKDVAILSSDVDNSQIQQAEAEEVSKVDLKSLAKACNNLLPTCEDAITAIMESLHECNTRRWIRRPTKEECQKRHSAHVTVLESLRKHKTELTNRTAAHLWTDYRHHFDEQGHVLERPDTQAISPVGELMLSLVLEERFLNFAIALEAFLTRIVSLEEQRTTTRLWLPMGIQKLFVWALHDNSSSTGNLPVADFSSEVTLVEEDQQKASGTAKKSQKDLHTMQVKEAVAQLIVMQARGGRRRNKAGQILLGISHWFSSTEGLYALRVLIVTIGVGVIAVVPSSAGFFYREKGLWALIMAQTGLLPYTADFVFGFVTKFTGTIVGAIIGLVAWYVGAGNGPGNPYGMAAIMALVIVVLMWFRLFTSLAALQGIVLVASTCYLVMGYSWDDTHIPSYGNPGIGYSVFWRRMLLVMIGFGVAAFVTLFPRPPSANRHYRRLLSEALGTVQNQYGLLALSCHDEIDHLEEIAEKTAINLGTALLEIEPTIILTKLEFSSSNFDAVTLQSICRFCLNLNYAATQLLFYIPQLPPRLKERFKLVTGVNDDRTMTNVLTALTLAQLSLKTGDALPIVLPLLSSMPRKYPSASSTVDEKDTLQSDIVFSEDSLKEEGIRKYCSAIAMFTQFLSSVDELLRVIKNVVGESGNARLLETA